MLDLTVIILTKNEQIHIERCLDKLKQLEAKRCIIIDSLSTDGTQKIADKMGAEVVEHIWPGNQAAQFNWGLENILINTKWVLRLDADEYLLPELVEEIKQKLPGLPDDVSGVVMNRRHIFMGKWMKHGIYPVKLLRLFRYGQARCEQRLMDEHIQLSEGRSVEFENDFCDHNLNDLSWFCHKHINYAVREAADLLDMEYGITGTPEIDGEIGISPQARAKRNKKHKYVRLPLFWRSMTYFLYRYFLKGAFLDGKEGFLFSFLQGWWYRTLVDAKVLEIKRYCGADPDMIRLHLSDKYNIQFEFFKQKEDNIKSKPELISPQNIIGGGKLLTINKMLSTERRAA